MKTDVPEIGLTEEFSPEIMKEIQKDRVTLIIGMFGAGVFMLAATLCMDYVRRETGAPIAAILEAGTAVTTAVLIILGAKTVKDLKDKRME